MNRILYSLLFLILQGLYLEVNAQALKIGDKVPDVFIRNVFNARSGELKLSDYKGKLIILDFWNFYCAPCLEGFKKVDSLQQKFKDQVQFITVISSDKNSVEQFFKKRKHIFLPRVPFITTDTLLHRLFPHQGVPFHVWIGPDGKLIQNADAFNLTEENILGILKGNRTQIYPNSNNVYVQTLFDAGWKDRVDFASYIARASPEVRMRLEGLPKEKGISHSGTIVHLYQKAFGELTGNYAELKRPGRLILSVADSSKYLRPDGISGLNLDKWTNQNYYYYQLLVPAGFTGNRYQLMLEDLNRYFNLEVGIRKREVTFLVLVRTSGKDKIKTVGGTEVFSFASQYKSGETMAALRVIRNKPFAEFSDMMRTLIEYGLKRPFVDKSGYTGRIDIQFKGETLDNVSLAGLKKELKRYDLDLVEQQELIDVLEVKERKLHL